MCGGLWLCTYNINMPTHFYLFFLGEVDDEVDMEQDRDWYDYWRILFKKIDVNDIKEFEDKYKGDLNRVSQ